MTWAIIIGIALMIVILSILFPTLFKAAAPVQNFQENCANYGGVLLNDFDECNGNVAKESTIVDVKDGYICCVKKIGVPQEYFDKWKEGEDIVDPDDIDSDSNSVSGSGTGTTSGGLSGDGTTGTSNNDVYDPGAYMDQSQSLLPGSITGHFYSRQRYNEHFCFFGVEAHTNPDQEPFALADVQVSLSWKKTIAESYHDQDSIDSHKVVLSEKQTYNAPDSSHMVPRLLFSLDDQELGLYIDNIEDEILVRCDKVIIGSREDIIESFFYVGTATCDLFTAESCLNYVSRPRQNLWFSLNCQVVNPWYGSSKCKSCSTVSSCEDYNTMGSCKANQCLISNFAHEDTDCFWVPKKSTKPEKGDCYVCESCAGYHDEKMCMGSNDECGITCFWNEKVDTCEVA